jgi:hypothetical protein
VFERSDYVSRQACVDISFINTPLLELGLLKTERKGELLLLREKKKQAAGENHIMRGLVM